MGADYGIQAADWKVLCFSVTLKKNDTSLLSVTFHSSLGFGTDEWFHFSSTIA
jgi:hypothetical protein